MYINLGNWYIIIQILYKLALCLTALSLIREQRLIRKEEQLVTKDTFEIGLQRKEFLVYI